MDFLSHVFCEGGKISTKKSTSLTDYYKHEDNKFVQAAELPTGVGRTYGCATMKDKTQLVVSGGIDENTASVREVAISDLNTNEWKTNVVKMPSDRKSHVCIVLKGTFILYLLKHTFNSRIAANQGKPKIAKN